MREQEKVLRPFETQKGKMWSGLFWAMFLLVEGISLFFGHAFLGRFNERAVSPATGVAVGSIFLLGAIVSLIYAWRRYRER